MRIWPSRKVDLHHRNAAITLLNAMQDPRLFGPWFKEQATWRAWKVVLRSLFALPILGAEDRALYQQLTGRTRTPHTQAREAWICAGRRAGKSFIGALIGVYLSAFRDYRPYLSPGEVATIMILAENKKQSRTIMRYAQALFTEIPLLAQLVEHIGLESITLKNPVVLEIHAASWRSTRGFTLAGVLADELAFWRSDESANPDVEILNALRPAMLTIPNSLLLCLSSPYARSGALWQAFEEHYGRDDDPTLVFKASTMLLNPTVDKDIIEQAVREDPVAASSEYFAEFRSDISTFLDPELITSLVVPGTHELPFNPVYSYLAATDPSGGRSDSFALALAHPEGKRLVLDVCRARRAPFDPRSVVAEYSNVLKQYGCYRVLGDRYSAEWVISAFREHGIQYDTSERVASEIFLECLPHFTTGAIQLLDDRVLLGELRQLERRTGRDKDVICHPSHGHDDAAVAACSALLQCARGTMTPAEFDRGALVVSQDEARAAMNEHVAQQGLIDDVDDGPVDSPWTESWRMPHNY